MERSAGIHLKMLVCAPWCMLIVSSRIVLAIQLTTLHAAHTDCTGMFVQYFMHTSDCIIQLASSPGHSQILSRSRNTNTEII